MFELELVNVANVKISSSNVANFQLGIGIGIGNISTLATFTSVGVGEWNHRPTRDMASLTLARLNTMGPDTMVFSIQFISFNGRHHKSYFRVYRNP